MCEIHQSEEKAGSWALLRLAGFPEMKKERNWDRKKAAETEKSDLKATEREIDGEKKGKKCRLKERRVEGGRRVDIKNTAGEGRLNEQPSGRGGC